jgi:hypothetical protein
MNPAATPETPQNASPDTPPAKTAGKGRYWPWWLLAGLAVAGAMWVHYRYLSPAGRGPRRQGIVYAPPRAVSQPTTAASPLSLVANPLAGENLRRLDQPPTAVVTPPEGQFRYGFRLIRDGVVMDNLNFTAPASVAAVEAQYRTSLTAQGYKEVRASTSAGGGGMERLFLRGSKEYYRIVLRRDDNAQVTTISLVVSHLQ